MKQALSSPLTIEAPLEANPETVLKTQCLSPFNKDAIAFASLFSLTLLRDDEARQRPELVALAYWMRKKNIHDLEQRFRQQTDNLHLPRGLAFHIAPSNVDTIFIYSLFLSIFCGNTNIVRLSTKPNPQVDILLRAVNACFDACPQIAKRVLVIRYDHNDEITAYFSSRCDLRIIWGGDETIRRIRALRLSPQAKEMTFADRFSLALIESQCYLDHAQKDELVAAFYNDCYLFNQMACSSPRLVCWVSQNEALSVRAQTDFWGRMEELIKHRRPDISSAALMDKYLSQCIYAIETENIEVTATASKFIARMQLSPTGTFNKARLNDTTLNTSIFNRDCHQGNGLFLEVHLKALEELLTIIERKDQSMTAFGFSSESLAALIENHIPAGVDRIVPFGEALDFSPVWDGYDLLLEMTRSVTVKTYTNRGAD